MERTLKRVAVLMFASTSSLATFALPEYSVASWSRIGAMMRHGPHHAAQKSTTARPGCFSISLSKFSSVTALAIDMLFLPPRGDPSFAARLGLVSARTDHRSARLMSDTPRRGTRIAHVGLAVRSAADLHSFYRNVLGMSEAELADSDGARISGFVAGES